MKFFSPFLVLLLAACSFSGASPTPTTSLVPAATGIPSPTPPLVILLAPNGSDPVIAAAAAEITSGYAAQNSMQFEQRDAQRPDNMPPNLSKLIVLSPDPGTAALAAAAPQASVITIGFDPGSAANITVIPLISGDGEEAAFIAGYAAALTADDWRVGMLYTAASEALVNDFIAGAEYFCGACTPVAPPYTDYPQVAQVAEVQSWQAAADALLAQFVRVVYLAPELEASGAAQYLAGFDVLLIGASAPPQEVSAHWLVTVRVDQVSVIQQQLPLALNGQSLTSASPILLDNAHPDFLSTARLTHVQMVIEDLLNGFITLPE